MAMPIRSIDIYLPLESNDGEPIAESKFSSVQQELLERFGGVTSIQRQFPLEGVWQSASTTYYDRVVVFSVMDFRKESQLDCLRFLAKLKARLKRRFDQLDILITVCEMLAI